MYRTDHDIETLARKFVAAELPKSGWTHAAHFAVAVFLIRSPDHDAMRDMPGLIRAHNAHVGTPNTDTEGYHATITRASIHMAAHILETLPENASLTEAVKAVLDSPCRSTDWIFSYWSRERLFSVGARRDWVPPDLKPLP